MLRSQTHRGFGGARNDAAYDYYYYYMYVLCAVREAGVHNLCCAITKSGAAGFCSTYGTSERAHSYLERACVCLCVCAPPVAIFHICSMYILYSMYAKVLQYVHCVLRAKLLFEHDTLHFPSLIAVRMGTAPACSRQNGTSGSDNDDDDDSDNVAHTQTARISAFVCAAAAACVSTPCSCVCVCIAYAYTPLHALIYAHFLSLGAAAAAAAPASSLCDIYCTTQPQTAAHTQVISFVCMTAGGGGSAEASRGATGDRHRGARTRVSTRRAILLCCGRVDEMKKEHANIVTKHNHPACYILCGAAAYGEENFTKDSRSKTPLALAIAQHSSIQRVQKSNIILAVLQYGVLATRVLDGALPNV